jgi:DNA repair protein RadD
MSYAVHQKPGRPPSLKATYFCGLRIFNEWVCFEHDGYAKHKAHEWWKERSAEEPPETSEEAKTQAPALRVPKTISVWINTKYPEVKGYGF